MEDTIDLFNISRQISQIMPQIDRLLKAGNIDQARILLQSLMAYIMAALRANPSLISHISRTALTGRMIQTGFTAAEVEATTTALITAEEALAVGATGSVGFWASTVVIAGVTFTMLELLGLILLIAIILGVIFMVAWVATDAYVQHRNRQLYFQGYKP